MVSIGDVAVKIAGRDAGQACAVVEIVDTRYVIVDGNTRRKKCNVMHLEFLGKQANIKKNATREEVLKSLKELGLKIKEVKKGKVRESKERPIRIRKSKKTNSVDKVQDSKTVKKAK